MKLPLFLLIGLLATSVQAANPSTDKLETAIFAGGCFWCLEAVYADLKGVSKVESGYSGGEIPNPSYESVCTGSTGHAEVVQISFNPQEISYADLLRIHLSTHDPTTLNYQGADHGTQYRSIILTHSEEQENTAEMIIEEMAPSFTDEIVTDITSFETFYRAEEEHQNYYKDNPDQGYCAAVINPKLKKFRKLFVDYLINPEKK